MSAEQLRKLFHVLHWIDRDHLEAAGVIAINSAGGSDWHRFNQDIGTSVLKLPTDRLDRLAALITLRGEA